MRLPLFLASALGLVSLAGAQPVLITSPTTINPGDTLIGGVPITTAEITVRGTTFTVNGRHQIASLALERSGATPAVVTHSAAFSFDYGGGDVVNGLSLIVTGSVSIQGTSGGVASRIDASGLGFIGGAGPGAGQASTNGSIGGTGGAHGGNGSSSGPFAGGVAYGAIAGPVTFGSGGGAYVSVAGGRGGGCVRLDVAGTLTIDGSIVTNGAVGTSAAGSGSGGGMWLSAGTLAGTGTVSANGANGGGGWGGGGGGRIAVDYSASSFVGVISATGGASVSSQPTRAGAGTVFIKPSFEAFPTLRFSAGGTTPAAPTPIADNLNAAEATLSAGANVVCQTPQTFRGNVSLSGGSRLQLTGENRMAGNATLAGPGDVLTHGALDPFHLIVDGDCTIAAGASCNVSGLGYPAMTGPGAGQTSTNGTIGGTGGAHGGNGASSPPFAGGTAYGSFDEPVTMGSGGGNYLSTTAGTGGGAARITVVGTLTLHGEVASNGTSPGSAAGAGAGGSIWITAGHFDGAGTIRALGGAGGGGWGGGGGGRIAIYYATTAYTGVVSAAGGFSASSTPPRGGAGTVLMKADTDAFPSVVFDNAGTTLGATTPVPVNLNAAMTTVSAGANVVFQTAQTFRADVTMTGNTRVEMSGTQSIAGDLTLSGTGNTLTHAPLSALFLTVEGACTIGTSSAMNFDGLGHPGNTGPGAGQPSTNAGIGGTGGGHGGRGSSSSPFVGGGSYGDVAIPMDFGSGGGSHVANPAGSGGGACRLTVNGALTVDGTISANGRTPLNSSGAGAGGSLFLSAGSLAGDGTIAANGGAGGNGWGGGGGGRIAAYLDANTFAGSWQARGGPGASSTPTRGGAGTLYLKLAAEDFADLIVDAGGTVIAGATPIGTDVMPRDVSISGGAHVIFAAPQTIARDLSLSSPSRLELTGIGTTAGGNALLASGTSTIVPTVGVPSGITIGGDCTIEAGSSINANAAGHPSDTGPGAGQRSTNGGIGGAGGGYGGRGGNSPPFQGGLPYGSETQPFEMGSGGGNYVGNAGGRGGGAFRLEVGGALDVAGTISADGQQPLNPSGAGSGGGLHITAGTLSGAGLITANGGAGGAGTWGPGGGGRVAVYSCNRLMPNANIRANGAGGTAQNGTVFFGSSSIVITEQPVGGPIASGSFTQLNVGATGDGPLTYQWRRRNAEGEFIALTEGQDETYFNVDSNTLFIQGIGCSGGGDYDCLICDSCGCIPSNVATIEVDPTGDYNDDGGIDGSDVDAFFFDWERGLPAADVNQDGGIDGGDVEFFFARWEAGC